MLQLFNQQWTFQKFSLGTPDAELLAAQDGFSPIDLPHDWMISNTQELYENSIGCYRKTLTLSAEVLKERYYFLRFEGVYMDTVLFINGIEAFVWKYGYSTFEFDATPFLRAGDNEIFVKCTYQCPNTRWYSGAGIFRDVYLRSCGKAQLLADGTYFSAQKADDGTYTLFASAEAACNTPAVSKARAEQRLAVNLGIDRTVCAEENAPAEGLSRVLSCILLDADGAVVAQTARNVALTEQAVSYSFSLKPEQVTEWDIEQPYLYTLIFALQETADSNAASLTADGKTASLAALPLADIKRAFDADLCSSPALDVEGLSDIVVQRVGFRTLRFDCNEGFFLNGRSVKIHGACQHHDLGALGSAFNKTALRRQLTKLQAMGINSIRTSHNMPAVALMNLADELGILINDEAFDMWNRTKTDYDYGNFFPEWWERDTASWVRRDRNHPSLIMWSIGNEIYDTHHEDGYQTTIQLRDCVKRHDPLHNGFITIGSNYIAWEGAQRCSNELELSGYNYAERLYAEHHEKFPHWCIYGSETSSTVQSRGIYHFPASYRLLTHDDLQCSSLGNCSTNWGAKNTSKAITDDRDAAFCFGQYIWTGWDYIGEPTPYHTKNSYFGQIDTAGFEKDTYYLYQAEWTDYKKAPMVHLLPYWDFNIGQPIDLRVYSNAPKTELFFRAQPTADCKPLCLPKKPIYTAEELSLASFRSLGDYAIDHAHGLQLSGEWQLPYEAGTLLAVAYDESGAIIAYDWQCSFSDPARLSVVPDKTTCLSDGEDLIFLSIAANDANGNFVANARNRIHVHVSGAGRLLGLDNGDSTDYEQYKCDNRKLFPGRLTAIIAAKALPAGEPSQIVVTVASRGLPTETLTLQALPLPNGFPTGRSAEQAISCTYPTAELLAADEIPLRKIELTAHDSRTLTKDAANCRVTAVCYPENATTPALVWRAMAQECVDSSCASITAEETTAISGGAQVTADATVTALGDGSFTLLCSCANGSEQPQVLSELAFTVDGLGETSLDPYAFVPACRYTSASVPPMLSFQGGVFTADEGIVLTFARVDFGAFGSDTISIPIFSFSDQLPLEVWEGVPDEGGTLLLRADYQAKSWYNHYQANTFRLPYRLKGMKTISLRLFQRLSVQGFGFAREEKAYATITAPEFTRITGDSYTVCADAVTQIGNNVSIEYDAMDFGDKGFTTLTVCGRCHADSNTIHVRFHSATGDENRIIEVPHSEDYVTHEFTLASVTGLQMVDFTFLPGSSFDLKWFRFS